MPIFVIFIFVSLSVCRKRKIVKKKQRERMERIREKRERREGRKMKEKRKKGSEIPLRCRRSQEDRREKTNN